MCVCVCVGGGGGGAGVLSYHYSISVAEKLRLWFQSLEPNNVYMSSLTDKCFEFSFWTESLQKSLKVGKEQSKFVASIIVFQEI